MILSRLATLGSYTAMQQDNRALVTGLCRSNPNAEPPAKAVAGGSALNLV